jgi:aminoglycoside phosphotransferase
MKKCISEKSTKSVYLDGDKVMKVFAPDYSKTDVLYEALNTARVEDTGLDIPKIISVSVEDKKWVITSEYAQGKTLAELLKEHPENADKYAEAMVEYQVSFNKRSNPLLLKLKDKLVRQINELDIDSNIRYELMTRLESLPKHNKLCHGDYCLDNIIVQTDKKNQITSITAVDWVHATQGNASADVANTYLMLKLVDDDFATKYLDIFCEKTATDKSYVYTWMPIVAAARMTKNIPEEKELLESMVNICDYQ